MKPFEKLVVNIPLKFGKNSTNGCIGDVKIKIAMLT